MDSESRQAHWQQVYSTKGETEVSWFQDNPAPSLDMIAESGVTATSAIIDIGGGASRLVDALIEKGYRAVTVLDVSRAAIETAKARLGDRARLAEWVVADVTSWQPRPAAYDLWHDRAAFHFLIEDADRAAYVAHLAAALKPGGHAIIATFAADGPERCSGLPVMRYDPDDLARVLGSGFDLIASRRLAHRTPWGSEQRFQFSRFRRS